MMWSRRAAALAVALLCFLPLHRLLSPARNGPTAADALARAEPIWSSTLWGSVLVVLVAAAGAWLAGRVPRQGTGARGEGTPHFLARPGGRSWALGVAALAGLLAGLVTVLLQRRLLTGVDEMAALIHARSLGAGDLGIALRGPVEAWAIPNMLMTETGWVSQYPPGHLLVWAAFTRIGLGWAAGPVLFALTAGLLANSFERLLPVERRAQARVASLLVAASPFLLVLAGSTTSHVTAGAAGALALWAALRARDGRLSWAVLAGAAVGLMVLARPWTGLVLGPLLTLGVWLEGGGVTLARRALLPWVGGGTPFALLLFWWNGATYGAPLTFGYEALYGPAHGLGLHVDPWGYAYGLRELVAYTASDLIQFGALLLETPVSLVLVGALFLIAAPEVPRGTRVVAAWALLPVAAQAFYWFHAPRMLSEATPAWILLGALSLAHALERATPALRAGLWTGTVAAGLMTIAFLPGRVRSLAWPEETLSRITVPEDQAADALVFVHAGWDERIAALLQATGMRGDSIQPILRRNDFCRLQEYARARLAGTTGISLPVIDLEQTYEERPGMISLRQPGGSVVWRGEGVEWSERCVLEMSADRFGAVALAPLLWQGDLPELERGEPMFVRDYGPEWNEAVRAVHPDREPMVWAYPPSGRPILLEYEAAMSMLWTPPIYPDPPPPTRFGPE